MISVIQVNFSPAAVRTTPDRFNGGGGVDVSSASLVEDCCGERDGFSCGYCKWWCMGCWWTWLDCVYKSRVTNVRCLELCTKWDAYLARVAVRNCHWRTYVAFCSTRCDALLPWPYERAIAEEDSASVSSVARSRYERKREEKNEQCRSQCQSLFLSLSRVFFFITMIADKLEQSFTSCFPGSYSRLQLISLLRRLSYRRPSTRSEQRLARQGVDAIKRTRTELTIPCVLRLWNRR